MEDELNESVKQLWLEGLTGSEIAKKLEVTRNTVLGRVHRMREAGIIGVRECDMRMRSIKEETRRRESLRVATLFDILRESPFEKEEPVEAKPPPPVKEGMANLLTIRAEEPRNRLEKGPIKFDQLTPMSCRYVLNDGDPKTFLFCGKVKRGRSYCEEHEKLCYYSLPPRRKK